ncbi:TrmB family transcriptional regulator [Halegenticoccus tardaugens]|uniref:TrmB family transcriptional regulator n=1 Tax=Halegenticoccus tardaugens TaxID=2071624 RepID=UPI00100B252A|nr:helix-turn-helix domain-containing protein [Halegenticoccus tardaugens]
MSADEHDAVASLERLGLSNYEARVFLALQKLGTGTARDVHRVAGVPRSQVYGAAEELEERGLVELQQSTPKRYRPVSLDAARERLSARLEREQERAFGYLERVQKERTGPETREDVWTLRGREPISNRVVDLVGGADERVLLAAAAPELVSDGMVEALFERAETGVEVVVVSEDPAVRELFAGGRCAVYAPIEEPPSDHTGRLLLCDDNVVLLSVRAGSAFPDSTEETAIWSADTALSAVLTQVIRSGMAALLGE